MNTIWLVLVLTPAELSIMAAYGATETERRVAVRELERRRLED